MADANPIIRELEMLKDLPLGPMQHDYYQKQVEAATPVKCSPLSEIFTPAEVKAIMKVIRPKAGQCYRNAVLMAGLFPDRCRYVEGFGWNSVFSVEHAFNKIDDKYIDITWELGLGDDVSARPYVALIEASADEVMADIREHDNITGDYYRHRYMESASMASSCHLQAI